MHQKNDPVVADFYNSKRWQKIRRAYKNYQHGICERCGQPGEIVHHKKHVTSATIYDPTTTMDFNNLELLCYECHAKEHSSRFTEQRRFKTAGTKHPGACWSLQKVKIKNNFFEKEPPHFT